MRILHRLRKSGQPDSALPQGSCLLTTHRRHQAHDISSGLEDDQLVSCKLDLRLSLIALTITIHAMAVVIMALVMVKIRVRLENHGPGVRYVTPDRGCRSGWTATGYLHGMEVTIWGAAYL
jgi:hypothetical protein